MQRPAPVLNRCFHSRNNVRLSQEGPHKLTAVINFTIPPPSRSWSHGRGDRLPSPNQIPVLALRRFGAGVPFPLIPSVAIFVRRVVMRNPADALPSLAAAAAAAAVGLAGRGVAALMPAMAFRGVGGWRREARVRRTAGFFSSGAGFLVSSSASRGTTANSR